MFNVGGGEIIVIALVALIVLGPQRLPEAARQVGKVLGDLRKLSSGFQNEMKSAFVEADDPTRVAARRNVLAKEVPPQEAADLADPEGATEAATEPEIDPADVDPAVSDAIATVATPRDPPATAKVTPPATAQTTSVTRRTSPVTEEGAADADVSEPPPPRSAP